MDIRYKCTHNAANMQIAGRPRERSASGARAGGLRRSHARAGGRTQNAPRASARGPKTASEVGRESGRASERGARAKLPNVTDEVTLGNARPRGRGGTSGGRARERPGGARGRGAAEQHMGYR